MSSSRLPGKMMRKIVGKPLIGYVLDQVNAIEIVDKVVVATSIQADNDRMCVYVRRRGFAVYRGKDADVLDRYYYAASVYHPTHIVRITGDCPLIDPEICTQLIAAYLQGGYDYASLSQEYAEGLDCEIFSFTALKTAYENAVLLSEREHVTLYIHNHSSEFKKFSLPNRQDESNYRITVDEEADFQVVKAIIEHLKKSTQPSFHFSQVKAYLDAHPEVMRLNSQIIRNEGLLKSLRHDRQVK